MVFDIQSPLRTYHWELTLLFLNIFSKYLLEYILISTQNHLKVIIASHEQSKFKRREENLSHCPASGKATDAQSGHSMLRILCWMMPVIFTSSAYIYIPFNLQRLIKKPKTLQNSSRGWYYGLGGPERVGPECSPTHSHLEERWVHLYYHIFYVNISADQPDWTYV